MYPKKLEAHTVEQFDFPELPYNNEIKAYYHVNDFPLNMHKHSFYEINIIVEGKGRHYIENQSFEANVGDVFVIPPNIEHGYFEEYSMSIFHIILKNSFLRRHKEELNTLRGFSVLFEIEPKLRQGFDNKLFLNLDKAQFKRLSPLMRQLVDDCLIYEKGKSLLIRTYALLIIGELSVLMASELHVNNSKFSSHADSLLIIKSIEYIHANYAEKLCIEDLARNVNMSRSTYLRHFETMWKCSPIKYLNDYRIRKSKDLLRDTDKTISTVAQDCGFFDSSHFIRVFTLTTGMTPKTYRKNKKG